MTRQLKLAVALLWLGVVPAVAQVGPPLSGNTAGVNEHWAVLTVGNGQTSAVTSLALPPTRSTPERIDVALVDPSLTVDLILPNGTVINQNSAAGSGYTFAVLTGNAPGQSPAPLLWPAGTPMVTIGTAPGRPGGVYQIRVNRGGTSGVSSAAVHYYAGGPFTAVAFTKDATVRAGESTIVGVYLDNGQGPISTAAITAEASLTRPVPGSISSLTLLGSQLTPAGQRIFSYQSVFSFSGALPLPHVIAYADSNNPNLQIVTSALVLGSVSTATVNAPGQFQVQVDDGVTPDLTSITWSFEATNDPVSYPVSASGPGIGGPANGIYNAAIPTSTAGKMSVRFLISTNLEGVPVQRSALSTFRIVAPTASLLNQQSSLIDDDGNGRPDRLALVFSVNALQPGTYSTHFTLQGSSGATGTFQAPLTVLASGTGQVQASVSAAELTTFNLSGSLQVLNVYLDYVNGTTTQPADYKASLGVTVPIASGQLDPGPIQFTGINSLAGVNQDSGGKWHG